MSFRKQTYRVDYETEHETDRRSTIDTRPTAVPKQVVVFQWNSTLDNFESNACQRKRHRFLRRLRKFTRYRKIVVRKPTEISRRKFSFKRSFAINMNSEDKHFIKAKKTFYSTVTGCACKADVSIVLFDFCTWTAHKRNGALRWSLKA